MPPRPSTSVGLGKRVAIIVPLHEVANSAAVQDSVRSLSSCPSPPSPPPLPPSHLVQCHHPHPPYSPPLTTAAVPTSAPQRTVDITSLSIPVPITESPSPAHQSQYICHLPARKNKRLRSTLRKSKFSHRTSPPSTPLATPAPAPTPAPPAVSNQSKQAHPLQNDQNNQIDPNFQSSNNPIINVSNNRITTNHLPPPLRNQTSQHSVSSTTNPVVAVPATYPATYSSTTPQLPPQNQIQQSLVQAAQKQYQQKSKLHKGKQQQQSKPSKTTRAVKIAPALVTKQAPITAPLTATSPFVNLHAGTGYINPTRLPISGATGLHPSYPQVQTTSSLSNKKQFQSTNKINTLANENNPSKSSSALSPSVSSLTIPTRRSPRSSLLVDTLTIPDPPVPPSNLNLKNAPTRVHDHITTTSSNPLPVLGISTIGSAPAPVAVGKTITPTTALKTAASKRRGRPPSSSSAPVNSSTDSILSSGKGKRRHSQTSNQPKQSSQSQKTATAQVANESLSDIINAPPPAKKKRRTTGPRQNTSEFPIPVLSPSSPSGTAADDVTRQSLFKLVSIAHQKDVVWTKIKGHPYWPTQLVQLNSELESEKRFKQAGRFRSRGAVTCVMYFGTLEIAFVNKEKACISWEEGLQKGTVLPIGLGGSQSSAKVTKPAFKLALIEVKGFCSKNPKFPRGWWCEPDVMKLATDLINTHATTTIRLRAGTTTSTTGATGMDGIGVEDSIEIDEKKKFQAVALKLLRDVMVPSCVRADSERICWAKLRGFPFWPVQVLPRNMAAELYPELKLLPQSPSSDCVGDTNSGGISLSTNLPCMFFGTSEVALVSEKNLTPFRAGLSRGYLTDSDRQDFIVAIGETWGYLQQPRIWPSGYNSRKTWWNYVENNDEVEDGIIKVGDNGRKVLAPGMMAPTSGNSSRGGSGNGSSDGDSGSIFVPFMPKYEHIKKSVWAEGVEPSPKNKKADIPCCECTLDEFNDNTAGSTANITTILEPRCVDSCCLNFASNFLCSGSCPAGKSCRNVVFHKRKSPKMRPFFTADQRGWGVKVEENVKKGQFVVEYVGEIINKDVLKKRLKTMDVEKSTEYYMMDLTNDLLVDAKFKGNLSRFINSSCEPNCQTQKWTDAVTGQTHVGIFAMQDIEPGTELTYNYCFLDFGLTGKKGKRSFECMCGTCSCCMLEPIEKELMKRMIRKRIEVRWDDGWYLGVVECYNLKKKRFRVQYDDGDCEDLVLGCPLAEKNDNVPFRLVKEKDNHVEHSARSGCSRESGGSESKKRGGKK